jgi:periplasmic protein TonB
MTLFERQEQLERELTPERIVAPATGSIVLHALLVAGIALYGVIGGFFHHNEWGSSTGGGGAMQVNLVTGVLPLPSDQPVNNNVLATETPSQAPAPPETKSKQAIDETAIPIAGKAAKIKNQTATVKTQQHQPQTTPQNVAQYGEQAGSSIPRAVQTQGGVLGAGVVGAGDFGSRFSWYVDGIIRKMSTSWYRAEVDPHTLKGARVYVNFSIGRGGNPFDVKIEKSSGSSTLDYSCQRAVQRVDTFGALPSAYNSSTLKVSYYCEY